MVGSEPTCTYRKPDGEACRATPIRDGDLCFWHSPEHAEEAAEARRLGGLRRRKEKVVSGSYDIEGLENVGQIRRLVEIAVLDTLALENSIARSRALIAAAGAAGKLLEVGELEERIQALERALKPRQAQAIGRRRR